MDRRTFLGMGLSGAAGVAVGASAGLAVGKVADLSAEGTVGIATVPFYGSHQSGIDTPQAAHGTLVAFALRESTDAERLQRLLRLWTTDAALLQSGQPSMGDTNPEIAATPASLTITVGLGWGAFRAAGAEQRWPLAVDRIPDFAIDRLEARWSGGDLVLQVSANDGLTVAHAVRELVRDAQPFATVAWQQSGWHVPPDVHPGERPRNLLGYKEGAGNPVPGTDVFTNAVWNDGAGQQWFAGGTSMVVRRIRMHLDTWEQVPPAMQDASLGRYRSSGAPLGGTSEYQNHDLSALDAKGKPVIPMDAHIRRADSPQPIFRRPFNYDDGYLPDGTADAGLLFIAYGADVDRYLAIQSGLAVQDALNTWTTPVGSALFAVPPGASSDGQWIGEGLFA